MEWNGIEIKENGHKEFNKKRTNQVARTQRIKENEKNNEFKYSLHWIGLTFVVVVVVFFIVFTAASVILIGRNE